MEEKKVKIYTPKEKRPVLLRACGTIFCLGTALLWIFSSGLNISKGDMLIMTGAAVMLINFSIIGARAERRSKKLYEEIKKLRESSEDRYK